VDAFHVGDGRGVKIRREIPLRSAEVDVLLDGPPALQLGILAPLDQPIT
jgi:hypothetical protein